MPPISSDARFLGIDLALVWREIRQPWLHMHRWPLLSWLTPDTPVLLLQADGGQALWLGTKHQTETTAIKARFTAIELPEDLLLRRRLVMPAIAEADIAQAVALEAQSISPFAAQDVALTYCAQALERGSIEVEIVLASRKQIAQYLTEKIQQTQQLQTMQGSAPEVWVRADTSAPMVLSGYGESARRAYATRRRHIGYGLVLAACALLAVAAVTPTAQLRLRAIEAVYAYDDIAQRAAPLVGRREALLQSTEQLGALSEVLAGRIEPLRVLETLTQVLPDDTSLQVFKLHATKVTITGTTANASALMQLLGKQPGLHDVRAPSAAMRSGAAGKEIFAIEFALDPLLFGVVGAVVAPAPAAEPPQPVAISPPANALAAPTRKNGPTFGRSSPQVAPQPAAATEKPAP